MAQSFTAQFIERFALPLLGGAEVAIGRPLGGRGVQRLLAELGQAGLASGALERVASASRSRLLAMGIAPPASLPGLDDAGALTLLTSLHDLLFLARPEAQRLRPALRQAILRELIALLAPPPEATPEQASPDARPATEASCDPYAAELLLRHALLEPLFRLRRHDVRRPTWLGETVEQGVPRARLPAEPGENLKNPLCWPELLRVVDGQGEQGLQALLSASPLTALWQLQLSVSPSPQDAAAELCTYTPLLQRRSLARLLCRRFVELGLPTVAQALSAPLGQLLRQAESEPRRRPDLTSWLALVSHLHWLSFIVFADQTALTVALPEGATPFFALFASLWAGFPQLAIPADVAGDASLYRRAQAHAERCRAAVPPIVLVQLQQRLTRALPSPSQ